jgi:hypothetical protein
MFVIGEQIYVVVTQEAYGLYLLYESEMPQQMYKEG